MIDRAAWLLRRQQWPEYQRWTAGERPPVHPPDQSVADIGAILEWIPPQVRHEERDPDRRGVRRMHSILGLLSRAG